MTQRTDLALEAVLADLKRSWPAVEAYPTPLAELFDRLLRSTFNSEEPAWWGHVAENGLPDRDALLAHWYETLIAPGLRDHQAALAGAGGAVLQFWAAARELAGWVEGLLEELRQAGVVPSNREAGAGAEAGVTAGAFATVKLALAQRREVRLSGELPVLIRFPNGRWRLMLASLGRLDADHRRLIAALYFRLAQELAGTELGNGEVVWAEFSPQPVISVHSWRDLETSWKQLVANLASKSAPRPVTTSGAGSAAELGERLVHVLKEFGIEARLAGPPIAGPAFIRFPLETGPGVTVNKVTARTEDLQLRLGLAEAPMIHIADGRLVVDAQRADRQTVWFAEIRNQLPQPGSGSSLLPLGVDLDGRLQFADLANPSSSHVLVAGTSGSGKSEWLRAALAGLVVSNTPATLRLVLIDPKRNAFVEARQSPYLLEAGMVLHPPEDDVVEALDFLVEEMERRYRLFEQAHASHLAEYTSRTGDLLPRIVCACDEYLDLVQAGLRQRKEIELRIFRLGAKARAAGIHLIIATQHASRDTVGGALKANLNARVCFKTATPQQSLLVIQSTDAVRLLGQGDFLYVDVGNPRRYQAPLLTPEERNEIFGARPQALTVP